jgi:hypothetical protein
MKLMGPLRVLTRTFLKDSFFLEAVTSTPTDDEAPVWNDQFCAFLSSGTRAWGAATAAAGPGLEEEASPPASEEEEPIAFP